MATLTVNITAEARVPLAVRHNHESVLFMVLLVSHHKGQIHSILDSQVYTSLYRHTLVITPSRRIRIYVYKALTKTARRFVISYSFRNILLLLVYTSKLCRVSIFRRGTFKCLLAFCIDRVLLLARETLVLVSSQNLQLLKRG